jgi:hypothetical protein
MLVGVEIAMKSTRGNAAIIRGQPSINRTIDALATAGDHAAYPWSFTRSRPHHRIEGNESADRLVKKRQVGADALHKVAD